MASRRQRLIALTFCFLCTAFAWTQTLSDARDHSMPPTGQVTVPAEGGLTFKMKVNGQGPFPTVFDTGAVNAMLIDHDNVKNHNLGRGMDGIGSCYTSWRCLRPQTGGIGQDAVHCQEETDRNRRNTHRVSKRITAARVTGGPPLEPLYLLYLPGSDRDPGETGGEACGTLTTSRLRSAYLKASSLSLLPFRRALTGGSRCFTRRVFFPKT
jgi:hypothetical protein